MKKTTTLTNIAEDVDQKPIAVNIFLSRAYDLILSWPDPEKLEEEPDEKTKKRTASGCHRDGSE